MRKLQTYIILFVLAILILVVWNGFGGKTVKLYFATKDAMGLQAEERKIKGDLMEETIKALVSGPTTSQLSPTLPKDVELLSLKVKEGTCVVNFSETLVTHHWGGSTGELLTIYSIVNTLAQFPGVERVLILVEGRKIETLAGHMILEDVLEAKMELVKD